MQSMITVEQYRSPIGRPKRQRAVLKGLGMNSGKIGRRRELVDTASTRGMVDAIPHMVRIVREYQIERLDDDPEIPDRSSLEAPAHVVRSMKAKEVKTRLNGIVHASVHLQTRSRDRGMGDDVLGPDDQLDLSSLPKRLYARMMQGEQREAEEAAYALVVNSKRFNGGLDGRKLASQLDLPSRTRFRTKLEDLLAAIGLRYVCNIEASKAGNESAVHLRVEISRRLAFKVGGKPVELNPRTSGRAELKLSCPAAIAPFRVVVRAPNAEGRKRGVIAIASAVVPLKDGSKVDRLPFTVFFEGAAEMQVVPVKARARYSSTANEISPSSEKSSGAM